MYDIEGWTGFTFPGRGDKYSKMKWNYNVRAVPRNGLDLLLYTWLTYTPQHFTGVDYDAKNEKTSIFKIHGDGKTWAEGEARSAARVTARDDADTDTIPESHIHRVACSRRRRERQFRLSHVCRHRPRPPGCREGAQ